MTSISTTPSSKEYVLGVTREEYDRLGLQHSLWASRAIRLWERAGLPRGSTNGVKVIDCGCGPGFTTFELAKYLGGRSRVVGIDMAEKYIRALENRAKETRNAGARIETLESPIDAFDLREKDFDAAYARWIFIFLKDPEAAIRNVARHLRPGGLFMLQEYVDYRTLSVHPGAPIFRRLLDAIIASWAAHGGDASVASRLPTLLAKNGFEIVGLKPQARIGRPHQKIWRWPDSFFRNYVPILARDGFLTGAEAAECLAEWARASANPSSFYLGPTVMDIIARKR